MTSHLLYEVNTRCWLRDLTKREGHPITLANVPDCEFERWQRLGFTHIWLMGVWRSGPSAREKALHEPQQQLAYSAALPGWTDIDVAGSPYAIADYRILDFLGSDNSLQKFREQLHRHGLRLLLDFVPNHLGLDHPWINERPELFVQSSSKAPGFFPQSIGAGLPWLAHGKDPNFAPWSDTVQLDYRRPETHRAMLELLKQIARKCDGVRCDMAMLLLRDVFAKTWQQFPSPGPSEQREFWEVAIAAIKQEHPEFLFLAEVYWGLEPRLQALGFDFTYDKELYDHLIARDPNRVKSHILETVPEVLARGARFLENHDERRIASAMSPKEHRMAAMLILSLPGMRFLHEGQFQGWQRKTPVQLLRRAAEPVQLEIERMYEHLLRVISKTTIGRGSYRLLQPEPASSDHATTLDVLLIQWQSQPCEFCLVAINLAPQPFECRARPLINDLSAHTWKMRDLLTDSSENQVQGAELADRGLRLALGDYEVRLLQFAKDGV